MYMASCTKKEDLQYEIQAVCSGNGTLTVDLKLQVVNTAS